jgi:hypothetical protein
MRRVLALMVMLGVSAPLNLVNASEWGCEVLLCAASDNPSWQGVQSCHPPMERLVSAMKRLGFSWPTCPEGGAGKPGYHKYDACPAGWLPSAGEQASDQGRSNELSKCSRTVDRCDRRFRRERSQDGSRVVVDGNVIRVYSGYNTCRYIEFSPRPLRGKPYYFDIRDNDNRKKTRHFFNLQK